MMFVLLSNSKLSDVNQYKYKVFDVFFDWTIDRSVGNLYHPEKLYTRGYCAAKSF
jgi:hypothetical protein